MILILSGAVRSGKTTSLRQWSSSRDDIGGVLSPDVDGLRRLYNVRDGKDIPWQKEVRDTDMDELVGRFVFDRQAFLQARIWLDEHLADPFVSNIIVDEIGPLELSAGGWDGWLRKALPLIGDKTLILVVRESLVSDVIRTYGLEPVRVVSVDYFGLD